MTGRRTHKRTRTEGEQTCTPCILSLPPPASCVAHPMKPFADFLTFHLPLSAHHSWQFCWETHPRWLSASCQPEQSDRRAPVPGCLPASTPSIWVISGYGTAILTTSIPIQVAGNWQAHKRNTLLPRPQGAEHLYLRQSRHCSQ